MTIYNALNKQSKRCINVDMSAMNVPQAEERKLGNARFLQQPYQKHRPGFRWMGSGLPLFP